MIGCFPLSSGSIFVSTGAGNPTACDFPLSSGSIFVSTGAGNPTSGFPGGINNGFFPSNGIVGFFSCNSLSFFLYLASSILLFSNLLLCNVLFFF